jgi:hypothetical protein
LAVLLPSHADAARGLLSWSPSDGATVSSRTPEFSIQSEGFDPTRADDNFWLAISKSFQVDYRGVLDSVNTFGCLFQTRPASATSTVYTAGTTSSEWAYCQLTPGQTYYWQIWFHTSQPDQVTQNGLVTCQGVTCHTKVMTLTVSPSAGGTSPPPSGGADFRLQLDPPTITVQAGSSGSFRFSIISFGGLPGPFEFASFTGLPDLPGLIWVEYPAVGQATIHTSVNAAAGSYQLTYSFRGGGLIRSATLTLLVTSAPATFSPPRQTNTQTVKTGSATWKSAARLPSRPTYEGDRSIKHTVLTGLIYKALKVVAHPRTLAVACWTEDDYQDVADSAGIGQVRENGVETSGFWLARQPRWLHLAPWVCGRVQRFLNARQGNASNARALSSALHEAIHAYGIKNEAQTNCYAVQLVPLFARSAGATNIHALYLGRLALTATRQYAIGGYWDQTRCRDGAKWDLSPTTANLQ